MGRIKKKIQQILAVLCFWKKEKKTEWINVNSKLPEKSYMHVLCSNGVRTWIGYVILREDDNDSYLYECGYIKTPVEEYKWFIDCPKERPKRTLEVLYWMYLPHLPILSVKEEYLSKKMMEDNFVKESKQPGDIISHADI